MTGRLCASQAVRRRERQTPGPSPESPVLPPESPVLPPESPVLPGALPGAGRCRSRGYGWLWIVPGFWQAGVYGLRGIAKMSAASLMLSHPPTHPRPVLPFPSSQAVHVRGNMADHVKVPWSFSSDQWFTEFLLWGTLLLEDLEGEGQRSLSLKYEFYGDRQEGWTGWTTP